MPEILMNQFESFDGTMIRYYEWGAGTARPPVVLHHGFVADATVNWVGPGIVDALASAGRRVVALDARGHGASEKPHDPARYGEETMARDLRCLFDVLGAGRVHLAGYSMGAVVSLIVACGDERVGRLVAGGVGAGVVELGGVDTRAVPTASIVEALATEDPAALTDPLAAGFRVLADAVGADRRALAAHAAALHARPIPLERITAPTLVVAGEDDPLAVRPQTLAAAVPGAELLVLPGDHLAAVGHPRFTEALTAFFEAGD